MAAILHVLLLLLAFTTGAMLVSTSIAPWIPLFQTFMVAAMFGSFVGMHVLLRRGNVVIVAIAVVSIVMLSGVAASVLDSTAGVYTMPMMIGIVLAGLTLGPRAPAVAAVAAACWLGVLNFGQRMDWFELERPVEVLGVIISQGFLLILTGATMTVARVALGRAFDTIDRQEEARRRLEADLFQAQKVDSIGRTAGGFAHDFNNLLGVVMVNAGFLQEEPLSREGQQSIADILTASESGRALTSKMLALGHRQVVQSKILDPAIVLEDFCTVLGHMAGRDVTVTLDCPRQLGRIKVDPNQLQQIVANLVINASHVSRSEDVVHVQLSRQIVDSPLTGVPDKVPPGDYLRLEVADSGAGMDEETLASAFEPFFTTKSSERGSGLGLAVVLGVIRQSGGFITVQTKLGEGTAFRLWFPAVQAPANWEPKPPWTQKVASDRSRNLQGTTIVLVDDDHTLRAGVAQVLTNAGADTRDFGRGQDALDHLRTLGAGPDLLLTDVMMPEMSGPELLLEMRARGFRGPVVYISGYVGHEAMQEHLDRADLVLQKPVPPAELVAGLLHAIGRPPKTPEP